MPNTHFESVDQYLAAQPEAARRALERVRSAIQKALPSAVEVISYQIPAYRQDGAVAIFFAGWREHYSVYPASRRIVAALGDALAPYAISKGTIRFPLSAPVPVRLIARIAKLRAEEVAAGKKSTKTLAKKPAKKKPAKKKPAKKKPAKKPARPRR